MSQHTDANRNDGCSRRLPPHASARSSFLKQSGATPKEVKMLQDLKNEVVFRLELAQREVDREHWRRQDSDHLHQREKRQRRSDADGSAQRHLSERSKSTCASASQVGGTAPYFIPFDYEPRPQGTVAAAMQLSSGVKQSSLTTCASATHRATCTDSRFSPRTPARMLRASSNGISARYIPTAPTRVPLYATRKPRPPSDPPPVHLLTKDFVGDEEDLARILCKVYPGLRKIL